MRIAPILCCLCCLLALAACYRPLYGGKSLGVAPGAQEARLNSVAIGNIPDEAGQKLRNLLIDRFYTQGRPASLEYDLNVGLTITEERLGIQRDATTVRVRLEFLAAYTLTRRATGKHLFSGTSRAIVSYNVVDQQYATLSAKENARGRGLRTLSELVTTRVLLAFDQIAQGRDLGTVTQSPAQGPATGTKPGNGGEIVRAPL